MEENMIEVRSAYKRYGRQNPILKGLDMTVEKGTIYGLLGPSGCGKTTLLCCIVARTHLDCGFINVNVRKKSQIGYMPQDTALFPEFSIGEMLHFYGTLYGMSNAKIRQKSSELIKMLDLPPDHRFVNTLSGGQQRRVSFAVALIHDPPLLILDEPTVGMDPILVNNIWDHLVKLAVVEHRTILITTHYIEEAKQSNRIGLMRHGVLLTEQTPRQLMESQGSASLEDAFLALSKKQHDLQKADKSKGTGFEYPNVSANSAPLPLKNDTCFNFSRFLAQLVKNYRWTRRNMGILLFILLLPAIQAYLFCLCIGKDPEEIPIALVSGEFSTIFNDCDKISLNQTYSPLLECNVPISFTCGFVNRLRNKLTIDIYENINLAKSAASKNDVWGVIYVSKNFSNTIEERISEGLQTSDYALDATAVDVWLDMSNFIISNIVKREITKGIVEFAQDVMETCGIARKVGQIPINFDSTVYGTNDPVYAHSTAAGFICSFIFYFTMTFTSGAIMMEKLNGLLERIMAAGMTKLEIVLAHLLVQFVVMAGQICLMLVVVYVIYDFPFEGDISTILSLLFAVAIVGISFGYLLSEIFKEEKLISYASLGTLMALFMINGCLWPLEGAHVAVKSWVRAFPIVAAVDSYTSLTLRGLGITHEIVYMGFVSCVSWVAIFSILTYYMAKKSKGA